MSATTSKKSEPTPVPTFPLRAVEYGFGWGPLDVVRTASVDGRGLILTLRTEHQEVEVYCTTKGKKLRFFDKKRKYIDIETTGCPVRSVELK